MNIKALAVAALLCSSITTLVAQQQPSKPGIVVHVTPAAAGGTPLLDIDAQNQDVREVLSAIVDRAKVNISFVGQGGGTTSVALRQATPEQAIQMVVRSAGLGMHKDNQGYFVGTTADLAAAFAPPPPAPAVPGQPARVVVQCEHVNASSLVTTLQAMFDPQTLKVAIGPSYLSPTLSTGASTYDVSGDQGSTISTLGDVDASLQTHTIVLSGDPAVVQQAIALATRLDQHRAQVKIHVKITDVSVDALRNFGMQWSLADGVTVTASETDATGAAPALIPGLHVSHAGHSPLSISATLVALERDGKAKLLAEPTISVLDGERSFILIGQRLLFPHLSAYSYGSPTYDIQEVRVGIYVQLSVQIGQDDDVILTVYPQVSLPTSYLEVNGARYPQISTREQQTTVRAKDKETIVIGGLIRDEEVRALERVPFLGRIPILGELFSYREKSRSRSELVMLLTPEIEWPAGSGPHQATGGN